MSYGPPSGPQNPGGYGPPPGGYPGGGYPGGGYPGGGYPGGQPGGQPPSNWLIPSILTTIFCCLPLGIVGIVFATQVNSKWTVGDYAGAEDSAKKAKMFTLIGAIGGFVVVALYILFVVIVGIGTATSDPYSTY
ncbi:hypothetical protein HDA32_003665 [Spinactinospora alkalitolerans]|uniref:Interferon-induced transmembrane protein n=1 Tax=Spinactinospora alkalitolerans TaxID=687207 RepID=A0A852TYX5_9ACTN|nr:CD225/dispanin family protein [Spinactinospora alkalitolerans]NYE48545.1 hypothetical protein [Spinactinospora alkalitolerans]